MKQKPPFPQPHTTETLAELAWRYGESGVPYQRHWDVHWFPDGSCLSRWAVDTPRGVRHTLDEARERLITTITTSADATATVRLLDVPRNITVATRSAVAEWDAERGISETVTELSAA